MYSLLLLPLPLPLLLPLLLLLLLCCCCRFVKPPRSNMLSSAETPVWKAARSAAVAALTMNNLRWGQTQPRSCRSSSGSSGSLRSSSSGSSRPKRVQYSKVD
jgi:hypothetical protein